MVRAAVVLSDRETIGYRPRGICLTKTVLVGQGYDPKLR